MGRGEQERSKTHSEKQGATSVSGVVVESRRLCEKPHRVRIVHASTTTLTTLPVHSVVAEDRSADHLRIHCLGPALAHHRIARRSRRCRRVLVPQRVLGVVETAPALSTETVAVEILILRTRADEPIVHLRVGETAVRKRTALFDCPNDEEDKHDERNRAERAHDANDRVLSSFG